VTAPTGCGRCMGCPVELPSRQADTGTSGGPNGAGKEHSSVAALPVCCPTREPRCRSSAAADGPAGASCPFRAPLRSPTCPRPQLAGQFPPLQDGGVSWDLGLDRARVQRAFWRRWRTFGARAVRRSLVRKWLRAICWRSVCSASCPEATQRGAAVLLCGCGLDRVLLVLDEAEPALDASLAGTASLRGCWSFSSVRRAGHVYVSHRYWDIGATQVASGF